MKRKINHILKKIIIKIISETNALCKQGQIKVFVGSRHYVFVGHIQGQINGVADRATVLCTSN